MPDIALAQRALDDKGQSIHVRQRALEVLIDRKTGFSSSDLKPYILHSEMRDWTLNAISNRLGNYGSSNQISKEKLITILKPLIPVFEDLAEQEDQALHPNSAINILKKEYVLLTKSSNICALPRKIF